MKRIGKFTVSVAGAALCFSLSCAGESATPASPYSAIPKRNVFNLEAPSIQPMIIPAIEEPPKLLPDGIITIWGRPEVLFKMATPQNSNGAQTKESAYVLGEGEQEDGVKVLSIDAMNEEVTFDNHGVVQQLPLTSFPAKANESKPAAPVRALLSPTNRPQ